MGWRVTLALSVAVAIALAVLWIDLRATRTSTADWGFLGEPRGEAPGEKIKRLLEFDPTAITAIHLMRERDTLHVERTNGTWSGGVDPRLLDDFLRNLKDMAEIAPLQVEAGELKDYGLDPPHGMIELERTGGPPVVVLLGQHNPAATGAYVQLGKNGPVVLTGALMLWEFDKAVKALGGTAAQTPEPTRTS